MVSNNVRAILTSFLIFLLLILGAETALAQSGPVVDGGLGSNTNDFELKNRDLVIRDSANRVRFRIDAQSGGDLRILDAEGKTVVLLQQDDLWLGNGGDVVLLPRGVTSQNLSNASVHIDGDAGTEALGGAGKDGQFVLRDKTGKQRVFFGAQDANLLLGQEGKPGIISVRDSAGKSMIRLSGENGQVQSRSIVSDGQVSAGQFISNHQTSAGSNGIDTASVYLESSSPAIGLRDTTGGNTQGWLLQSDRTGALSFTSGNLNGLSNRAFVLRPNGGICIGACQP